MPPRSSGEDCQRRPESGAGAVRPNCAAAFADLEVNLTNEGSLKDQQQDLEVALKGTEDALSLGKIKFQIGEIDMQPVLLVESAVLGAQTAVTGLQFERLATHINVHLAVGGGF